jgi:hypothetical protein
MKRIIAATIVVALISPALPAFASEGPAANTDSVAARQATHAAISLRASAKQAVDIRAGADTTTAAANAPSYGPRSMPRQPSDGTRYQAGGGGKTGMIIGIVSAAAGIAATVYMVKYMKKSTDAATAASSH